MMAWWQAWLIAGEATMALFTLDRDFALDFRRLLYGARHDPNARWMIPAATYGGAVITVLLWPPFLLTYLFSIRRNRHG